MYLVNSLALASFHASPDSLTDFPDSLTDFLEFFRGKIDFGLTYVDGRFLINGSTIDAVLLAYTTQELVLDPQREAVLFYQQQKTTYVVERFCYFENGTLWKIIGGGWLISPDLVCYFLGRFEHGTTWPPNTTA